MRRREILNHNWIFNDKTGNSEVVNLPHTWNALDGQDGGDDYVRGACLYKKRTSPPDFDPLTERVYLEFEGVNSICNVRINGKGIISHENGYSTFRADVTDYLAEDNLIEVTADNSVNNRVYPQKADFTFYGGIYRPVYWMVVNKAHFDLDYYGGEGVRINTRLSEGKAVITADAFVNEEVTGLSVRVLLYDAEGNLLMEREASPGENRLFTAEFELLNPHLWNGVKDPYLYKIKFILNKSGEPVDELSKNVGIREFCIDVKKGFNLNCKPYPLKGVARHQDFKDIGNAITPYHMEEDMKLILEMGSNAIRLAHYQHSQYFYDLCDKYGLLVWAEIPYISEHLPKGDENTHLQMRELIVQNYNHPSIFTWGISNEITISTKDKEGMLKNHKALQNLCKRLDPYRPTSMACYAMCTPFNPVTKITDTVSWNLYLGWYVPMKQLNDVIMPIYHLLHPKQPFGYSEYGAEGMPGLHSHRAKRGDHTEEYQAHYHEYMLNCFRRHKYLFGTFVWNMFDFAADARNQGGEPGMNHKGLVTFDRKIKKDSFYLYKAYWSEEPFVYIAGKRHEYRKLKHTHIKVYTNCPEVKLYRDGSLYATAKSKGDKRVFDFIVEIGDSTEIEALAGECRDKAVFKKTGVLPREYRLGNNKAKSKNWM